jgi:thiamine kinase-like enzyme
MVLIEDMEWINRLVSDHFSGEKIESIERLGGLTNHTYVVTMTLVKYVFRLPGKGTELIINRYDEKISTQLACDLRIDTPMFLFDENSGVKIMTYIEQPETMSPEKMRKTDNLVTAAYLLQRLHRCGKNTLVRFEIFEMAQSYEDFIYKYNGIFYADYMAVREKVMQIKNRVDQLIVEKVPCHNDPLCENWIRNNERMYLIDWEYAGMNDPMWDLADLSIEAEYTQIMDEQLLSTYLERVPTNDETLRFQANKVYLDFLWSLWGKTRVPFDGEEMERYALHRYNRLKDNLSKII